jgi:RNA recognition motif-containing protein
MTLEQLKLLFAYYGTVVEVRMAGDNNQYAFVEFSNSQEALGALAMNGVVVGDRALKVPSSRPSCHLLTIAIHADRPTC